MAEYNKGYVAHEGGPPSYNQMNIPGQNILPPQQGQPVMYQQQGQPMMYAPSQGGQHMVYGPPMGQQMGYGPPPVMQGGFVAPPVECWMAKPTVSGCPPGLEYLTQIDQLLVKQKIELFEVMTGYETNNKYDVKNVLGQTIYRAKEDTECCARYFCGSNRPFTIHISDNMNHEVIQVRRQYKCHFLGHCLSCSECCQDEIEVESPPGVLVGYVKQCYEGCNIRYAIMDTNREQVLCIHGPNFCKCYCPGDDYPLSLMSSDEQIEVGKISKQWSNLIQEYFTDADNFGIQFPMDLDVRMKAVVLGAVFLIDFMFFENNQQHHHHNHHHH